MRRSSHSTASNRGYNPTKPGRPSHVYHSFWVAHLRLCLDVQVLPGNQSAGSFSLCNLLEWLRQRPAGQLPKFVRGDISYGTQRWMTELETLGIDYLFKLKQTKSAKKLIAVGGHWTTHFSGWQYCEGTLRLSGWDCSRRVFIYRRAHRRKCGVTKRSPGLCGPIKESRQLALELLVEDEMPRYEYAVYVTSFAEPAKEIRSLYNPRGGNENCYDELKNQRL